MIKCLVLYLTFIFLFSACSNGADSSSLVSSPSTANVNNGPQEVEEIAPVEVTLNSINVYSDLVTIPVEGFANLIAIGFYSNGSTSIITNDVVWSSSNTSAISISGIQASGVGAGSSNITASLDGKTRAISLFGFNATMVGIEVNYQSLNLPTDGKANLVVTGIYDNGQSIDITQGSTFTSNDSGIITVNASGVVSAVAAGTTTIEIDYGGFNHSLPLEITNSTIDSIQVSPIIGSKAQGGEQQFIVTANLSDGSTLDITANAGWNSGDESIIDVNSSGLGSLLNNGSTTITASYEGFSSNVNFTVLDKNLSSIAISLSANSLSVGVGGQVTCIATYSDGTTEDITKSAMYSVSDSSVAIISNNNLEEGRINTIGQGSVLITASFGGMTISENLIVTGAILQSITIETKSSLISEGINAYFTAIGNYDDATSVDITSSVSWSLSNLSYGAISNSGQNKGLFFNSFNEASTSTLTVSAALSGVTGNFDVLLAPGTISSISINPSSAILNENENVDFKAYAHFSDGASVDITDISSWTSADQSLVMVSSGKDDSGRVSAISEGMTNVRVQYNGLTSGDSSINVDNGLSSSTPDEGTGLLASYFSGTNFDTLKGTRIDSVINYNWAAGLAPLGVGDSFSVRWTGKIKGKYTGDCQVSSRSDDGFRILIGGTSVIDVWFNHAPRWDHNYLVPFVEGEKQDIVVEFYENSGHAVAELYWQCPGDSGVEVIPVENLFPE
ncbi:MAG: hypothetical protein ACJAS4_003486 [Bacteriovoracaceae bacterium]|jgi:hypothetical protein